MSIIMPAEEGSTIVRGGYPAKDGGYMGYVGGCYHWYESEAAYNAEMDKKESEDK